MERFEDVISAIQRDMLEICMEYSDYRAEHIFIMAFWQGEKLTCRHFYCVGGKVVRHSDLNQAGAGQFDVSPEIQVNCNMILLEDMRNLAETCKRYNKPIPSQMKIHYDVGRQKAEMGFQYDSKYGLFAGKKIDNEFNAWFTEASQAYGTA